MIVWTIWSADEGGDGCVVYFSDFGFCGQICGPGGEFVGSREDDWCPGACWVGFENCGCNGAAEAVGRSACNCYKWHSEFGR
jgi:hypothetical protein